MNAEGRSPTAGPLQRFIAELRERTAHIPRVTPLPPEPLPALREIAPDEDLVQRFSFAAGATGLNVHQAGEAEWPTVVREILTHHGARNVVVEQQPGTALSPERARRLRETLEADGVDVTARHDDTTLFDAAAAVTGVTAAVAETGTLVCAAGPSSARGASLIVPLHIALLTRSQLFADLFDYFAALSGEQDPPANINLISGPSKTADIEGILITGVHGPGAVHAVIVG